MANAKLAIEKTLRNEGFGLENDPVDRGGQTYCGISRVHWPAWPGWGLIDAGEAVPSSLLYSFYGAYWNSINGDAIMSQPIAERLYDMAVNMGAVTVSKMLQRCINLFLKTYQLDVDGKIGPNTASSLNSLPAKDQTLVLLALKCLHGAHYITLTEKDPSQKRFIRGWLNRVGGVG